MAQSNKSPIIEVVVGSGESKNTYSAHEAVIVKSPELVKQAESFAPGAFPPPDHLPGLRHRLCDEYLYTGEYFPKKTSSARGTPLEKDPRQPILVDDGAGLLVHARIYTLAERLSLPEFKSLAHSKIHRTVSTTKVELAYGRFVYKESNPDDQTIRKPVAAFWSTRSYNLPYDAELDTKAMCLEFPQFSYDVLQLVLDRQEKSRERAGDGGPGRGGPSVISGSTRKWARVSHI